MEITHSALKHGIEADDIAHAWQHAIRIGQVEYDGEERILAIGPDAGGRLLELVAVPGRRPARIIHADRLRPKFYDLLRSGG